MKDYLIKRYMQSSSNVFAENKLLRYAIAIMLLVTLINSVSIANIKDSVQTHIIPVGTQSNFILTGSTANDDYLKAMARYIVHMTGNMTPASARGQFNELLTLWHPTTYAEYRARFDKLADSLERYPSISYHIVWDGERPIKKEGDSLRINVIKKKLVGDTVQRKTQLDIEINYVIEQGRFFIVSVKEVGGEQV